MTLRNPLYQYFELSSAIKFISETLNVFKLRFYTLNVTVLPGRYAVILYSYVIHIFQGSLQQFQQTNNRRSLPELERALFRRKANLDGRPRLKSHQERICFANQHLIPRLNPVDLTIGTNHRQL